MFKITRNTTIPSPIIQPSTISVSCFQLTSTLPNFSPMFRLEHINEVAEVVDNYIFSFNSIPSSYQVVELDILSPNIIDDLDMLYFNGSKYQNLLSIDEFNVISKEDNSLVPNIDTLSVEEREST